MFLSKIKLLFFVIIIFSSIFLFFNLYRNYIFDNYPLSKDIQQEINAKVKSIQLAIKKRYGINFYPTLIISDEMPHGVYGLTVFTNQSEIKILLNKKRFKESKEYMIKNVIAHEYAHALMFRFGNFSKQNSGHSVQWQNACLRIGGVKCGRFVNYHDIAIGKARIW